VCKTKVVCTLGPASRAVEVIEELLRAGMNVARFNFSHGSHEYHKETLDNLRRAMENTKIMCAVMLDTKGPEIRTGMLEGGKPVQLVSGQDVTITTDYAAAGSAGLIAMRYGGCTCRGRQDSSTAAEAASSVAGRVTVHEGRAKGGNRSTAELCSGIAAA
jgi:pyruvate kinase